MQRFLVKLLLPVAVIAASSKNAQAVTPVQKVLQLLDNLLENGKAEKHDENVRQTAFMQWCDSTSADKTRSIEDAASSIVQLSADIEKANADIAQLGEDLDKLGSEINGWSTEMASATAMRKTESDEYSATHTDYSESLEAIQKALQVLKARGTDVPQSLLQKDSETITTALTKASRLVPTEEKRALLLAAAVAEDTDGVGPPKANAYEFQSGTVVDMIEKLFERFTEERRKLEVEETNRKHAFELVKQSLTDNIKNGEDITAQKTALKARTTQEEAEAQGDLKETTTAKQADETYLRDITVGCEQKSKDFESRQVLRGEEIEALQKAVEIISGGSVSGAADTYLPGALVQLHGKPAKTVLAQMRRSAEIPGSQQKAAALLTRAAEKVGSQLLATVAGRVGEDTFGKVKQMIKDLITRLVEEANAEADHKGWCDAELATNKETRDQKTAEVDDLTSEVEKQSAKEAKLTQEIAQLSDEIAEIDKAVLEATKARTEEKEKNAQTLKDAKEAEAAVQSAIEVLKVFYAKASTATAMVQQPAMGDAPVTFDGAYTGMQSSSGGVLGMLEVIESDFARLAAETTTSEDEAAREFEAFSEASATDKKSKESEARHKGFELVRATRALGQAKKDLEATQGELTAALNYYDKLKPTCIGETADFGERTAMREEEVQSLKEALRILDGEEMSAGV